MGGVLILFALGISTLLWVDLRNALRLGGAVRHARLWRAGLRRRLSQTVAAQPQGRVGRVKLIAQAVIGLIAAVWIMLADARRRSATALAMPVFKEVLIPLGFAFPVFGMLVMLGASNAVNLTDGLDGLAIVPTIICAGVFALIAYLVGNRIFADYLQLNPVPGVGELACSAPR